MSEMWEELRPHDPASACGCCEDRPDAPAISNPPGQPALRYRIGTHASFLRRMLARVSQGADDASGQRVLAQLTTRATDDPAIALLDAWATMGHVLTFYQERIANEGYLRTATERRSILELARAIGYELNPGVAASAYLAFEVDESDKTPDETTIRAGTQVQSIPTKEGELPQTFETAEDFEAKAWWNTLRPQAHTPQALSLAMSEIYLQGASLNLKPGDRMLLVQGAEAARRRIRAVEPDASLGHTLVRFEAGGQGSEVGGLAAAAAGGLAFQAASTSSFQQVTSATLSENQLQAVLNMSGLTMKDVVSYSSKKATVTSSGEVEVYIFREKAGIFGHNAPHYATLSTEAKAVFNNWDNPDWDIWEDSIFGPVWYEDADLYLDHPIEGILAGSEDAGDSSSFLLLERTGAHQVYRVRSAVEGSMTGFGISARVMGLELDDLAGNPLGDNATDKDERFKVRKTTAFVKSERLQPAAIPVTADLQAGETEIRLDAFVPGLAKDQPIAISGERSDAEGVMQSEVRLLDGVVHSGGFTTLKFKDGLEGSYRRQTVEINANVVRATHGETVAGEALGSGDGARSHQRFRLKKPPLTYVSASTPSGAHSSLSLRVNGVKWQQAPSLYGLAADSHSYVVRLADNGDAVVMFGDGIHGARLPTGQENVVAAYRSGIGAVGEVEAGSLTLMKKRPFGVRSVSNPVAAAGADDPETLDEARANAPLTVLTLERIVSLLDYENFARAFAGIGKAQAVALWNGEQEMVHISIAGANGGEIAASSDLFRNLRDAIAAARDPLRAFELASYRPRYFELQAWVLIDDAYDWETLEAEMRAALEAAFSFQARAFGQPVTAAEVMTVLHTVMGVTAVDLDKLYVLDSQGQAMPPFLTSVLPAARARPNPTPTAANPARFLPAEMLMINTPGIVLFRSSTS